MATDHQPPLGDDNGKHAVDAESDVKLSNEHTEHYNLPPDSSNMKGLQPPPLIAGMDREYRAALEKRLVRKIDTRLMPMIILMYIMNYLDRNNIASARYAGTPGLEADLGLVGNQYQVTVSILFVGYILMQVPSNLFLNRFGKPAIYLPACMVIWGTISSLTAATHSYAGILAIRFFLGFIEAAYFPGCLFFLSSWYTRKELGFRTALLYSGSLLSGAFSGLIAAGITSGLDGAKGLPAWRWLFIIEGVITIFFALIAFFVLPNFPATTSWLTLEERELAMWRLKEDVGVEDWVSAKDQSLMRGFKLCLADVKTWVLMAILTGIVSSAGVTNFYPTVVKTLNYSNINTLLLTAPPYVLAVIVSFANAWHADRTGERYWHITIPLWVSVVGFILAVATTSTAPRYVAMMLMLVLYGGYVVALAWISNCLPRPPEKRAAALALINCVSNMTNIYASFMYQNSFAPQFVAAMCVNIGTIVMAIVGATVLRFILAKLNRSLDRGEVVEGMVGSGVRDHGMGEAESRGFRFLL